MSANLDTLMQRLGDALLDAGFSLSSATADGCRAVADRLPMRGHLIDLRTACWWTARAFDSRAEGYDRDEAWWVEKATAELNRALGAEG